MLEIRNARLAGGRLVRILIDGDMIVGVDEGQSSSNRFIDVRGLPVVPALNSVHVHDRFPGGEHKEDWEHLDRVGALGGVAIVGRMPNTSPPITDMESFLRAISLIGTRDLDHRTWFGATNDNFADAERALVHPLCIGLKIFAGSSEGSLLVSGKRKQYRHLAMCADLGKPAAVHSEKEIMVRRNRSRICNPELIDHGRRIRTARAAIEQTEQLLGLADKTGCTLVVLHVTTVEELRLCLKAKQSGLQVLVEVCPQYWCFSDEMLLGPGKARFKINPPLRPPEQYDEFLEWVCKPGVVDFINPDHAPHTLEEKGRAHYDQIPSGMPGLEELFPAVYTTLVRAGHISLERFVELTSTAAARAFNLPNGCIDPGYRADLVAFDPEEGREFTDESAASKCGWTPHHGNVLYGIPKMTMVRGKVTLNNL